MSDAPANVPPAPDAAPPAVPAETPPASGGSYLRDPATGALTRLDETAPSPPDAVRKPRRALAQES